MLTSCVWNVVFFPELINWVANSVSQPLLAL